MLKNFFSNPSIIFLLAGNLYCIWYYDNNPGSFATIVWIYWFQSVIIGFFNFVDLLTVRNFSSADFTLNDKPVSGSNKGCAAWFFLFHFGMFNLAYGIYLLVKHNIFDVDKLVWMLGVATFLMESVFNFIRHKQEERTVTINLGNMFLMPYLRIIPMHLMILLPAITGWKPSLLFLVLKMVADVLSALMYHRIYKRNNE